MTQRTALSTLGGTWQTLDGSGSSNASDAEDLTFQGTVTYAYQVPGGTVTGSGTQSENDQTGYTMNTAATLNVADGTWTTTGSLVATAGGTQTSSYAGSGTYDTGTVGVGGTFGPPSLQITGSGAYDRTGTITESGQAQFSYGFTTTSSLAADGTWQSVSGTGSSDGSGGTDLGYSGIFTYIYPLPGGSLSGGGNESEDDQTSYTFHTVATLDPTSGTWTTTGTLTTTANGTASSSYQGSGSYDTTFGEWGVFGPAAIAENWNGNGERTGTVTENGTAQSSYNYTSDAALQPDGTWQTTDGTGTFTGSGTSMLGYNGSFTYDHADLSQMNALWDYKFDSWHPLYPRAKPQATIFLPG